MAVTVDFEGQLLWADATQNDLFLYVTGKVLHVKLDVPRQLSLRVGDLVHVFGQGLAGQGLLNEALADNDGLHATAENSGTIFLGRGRHPFRAECFNGSADFVFEVEYSGPNLTRRTIPASAFTKKNLTVGGREAWEPGLNYRCFQGTWERLPSWREWLPIKSGVTPDLNLAVRTQDQNVGLEFTGYLNVEAPGDYTFWTKSDDGSRLFIGDHGLIVQKTGTSQMPAPRDVQLGQNLAEQEDVFWARVEGLVTGLHVDLAGMARVELTGELGRTYVEFPAGGISSPQLFSRFRAVGLCRSVPSAKGGRVAGRLQVMDASLIQMAKTADEKASATTLAELRQLAASGFRTSASLCLTGMVRCVATPGGWFAFEDETGGVLVQMDVSSKSLLPGQRIVIRGTGAIEQNRLLLTSAALVDNNGLHVPRERDGAIFLNKGQVPLHVSWFNRINYALLEVYYQGPGISWQKIPSDALVHPEVGTNGSVRWVAGLNYAGYRGDWQSLPKTSEIDPVKMGTTTNFDERLLGQTDKVGLEFDGFLKVPRDGNYIFTVNSDDGAQLYLGEQMLGLQKLNKISVPPPAAIVPRQILDQNRKHFWAQIEGTVNFIHERNGLLYLELGSDYASMNIEVADSSGLSPLLMLGSRVKVSGYCEGGVMSGGQEIASTLIVPGRREIVVLHANPGLWNRYPLQSTSEAAQKIFSDRAETIVRLQGRIAAVQDENQFRLVDESGSILVQSTQILPVGHTNTFEVLGRLVRSETNITLCGALLQELEENAAAAAKKTPSPLTKILPIKQLSREQAQQGLPVKIRGVITLVRGSGTGFILQDDTSAIDIWWPPHSNTSLPRVGDFWEIEGNTFIEFSPYVRAQRAVRLGTGVMPEPLRPDWDQLLNGSLDTRFVELQGIVTSTSSNGVTLFTSSGKINVLLSPLPAEPLTRFQNALVRIRGCVVPVRDEVSQQVQIGQTRLSNVSLGIDEPAPSDPMAAELKRPSELLLFDARAGSLRRVKIAGQILHVRGRELFLADETNSVRVLLQVAAPVQAGDLVEVVGFPELGGPSPVLREAVLRQTGTAPLPAPRALPSDALFNKGQDGALIALEARLVGVSGGYLQRVLELQNGNRDFVARVVDTNDALVGLVNGSRLRLTGVYAEERGRTAGQTQAAFELLLNSTAGISVLERPPWWTPRRVLLAIGALLLTLLFGAIWIVLLHRRVEEAATELATEVRHREKIQQQNILEMERTRIAKDMHDQLGTSVTQVGLLAELTKRHANDAGKTAQHADQICRRAVELGQTLDAIVWAVNPKNDSLDKFCDYMAVHAQELFQLTDVLCRVDLPPEMPNYPLTAEVRHNLFLATKEALNNVVRHAGAREVWIRFKLTPTEFQLSIADDGRGFVPKDGPSLRNGLVNMQKRLEDIGGRFAVGSQPGQGTEVTFILPLPPLAKDNPAMVTPAV